jgi:uncharacterized protein (TIGR03437 family)
MTIDPLGNIYVADQGNRRVRKISGAPFITANAVVNGASFASGGIVAGSIATAFGSNLTNSSGISVATTLPLPTQVQGVQVLVNGIPAPIFAVANVGGLQQVNFQVPFSVAGSATVQVVNNGTAGNSASIPVIAAQPGIFTYTVGPSNFGAILHDTYALADTSNPAAVGETVQIYCTGLGAVSPVPADGMAAPGAASTTNTLTATVGGVPAAVAYSGLAPGFVGLYQVNLQVPAGVASGNQPVILTIGGASSAIALLPIR